MRSKLLEASKTLPVSVQDVKTFARIDHNDDDFLLEGLIKTAAAWVEEVTGKTLLKKKWVFTHSNNEITLPHAPVIKILEVKSAGKVLKEKDYTVSHVRQTKRISMPFSWNTAKVSVTYTAGFGDKPSDIPETLRHTVMSTVTYIYENRYPTQQNCYQAVQPWIAYNRSYGMA